MTPYNKPDYIHIKPAILIVFSAIFISGIATAAEPGATLTTVPFEPSCLNTIGVRSLLDQVDDLTGSTVRLGIVELAQASGDEVGCAFMPNFEHAALEHANRGRFYYYDNPLRPVQYSAHATMIAGILLGDDADGFYEPIGDFHYKGILPDAKVDIYQASWFIYKQILDGSAEAIAADILTISWGTDSDDRRTMWWQRGIDKRVISDSCIIVAGCGNGRSEFDSISKPSWGYNVISVGAADSLGDFPDCLGYIGRPNSEHSSFGPTDDGRAKPDIIAPGLAIAPSADQQDGYSHDSVPVGYSSFATPQVAGVAGLLLDAARISGLSAADDPRVIKALLLNGADKLTGWHKGSAGTNDDHYRPLDYRQGAGLLNAIGSYSQLLAGRYDPTAMEGSASGWDIATISFDPARPGSDSDGDSEMVYYLDAAAVGDEIRATVCWYRHYKDDIIFSGLPLNNIVLELWSHDRDGTLLERLDYSAGEQDNLQHLFYTCSQPGRLALLVRLLGDFSVDQPVSETYGLAFTLEQQNWSGDRLSADLNTDGIVNVVDLLSLVGAWRDYGGRVGPIEPQAVPGDINSDGRLDGDDFATLIDQWQQRSDWHKSN